MAVTGIARILFLFFNTLFMCVGLFLLAISLWFIGTNPTLRSGFVVGSTQFTYTLLSVGLYIVITAIIGMVGAIREGTCLIKTYIILMVLLMAVELAGPVTAYILRDRLDYYRFSMWSDLNQESKDYFQRNHKCCGFNTFTEYSDTILELPDSCFPTNTTNKNGLVLYTATCWPKLVAYLNGNIGVWLGPIIGGVVLEIICLILLIVMLVQIMRSRKSFYPRSNRTPVRKYSNKATAGRSNKPRQIKQNGANNNNITKDYENQSTKANYGSTIVALPVIPLTRREQHPVVEDRDVYRENRYPMYYEHEPKRNQVSPVREYGSDAGYSSESREGYDYQRPSKTKYINVGPPEGRGYDEAFVTQYKLNF